MPKTAGDEETILDAALEAGAEDMGMEDDHYEIKTDPTQLANVRQVFDARSLPYASADLTMLPKSTQALAKDEAKRVLKFIEALEELDDVQDVYANFDIPDAVMEEAAAEV